jgi:hypothetical protein
LQGINKISGNKNTTLWKVINKEMGKSKITKNIPMEFNLGNRSHNRVIPPMYLINIISIYSGVW